MNSFPDLFSFCTNSEAKVSDVWSRQGWNLTFRRHLNVWEVGRVAEMLQVLDSFKGIVAEQDTIRWKHARDGKLTVRRLCTKKVKELPGCSTGPWGQIWKNKIPSKINCFTWLVVRRACLTHEKLQGRDFQIASWCSLCNEAEETNNHLFLHCNITAQRWALFLSTSHTLWTMPEHTSDLLSCWIRRGGSKSQKKWWNIIPPCIWWTIWRERNNRCSENIANSVQKLKWNCIKTFYFWCKEDGIEEAGQLLDFIDSL